MHRYALTLCIFMVALLAGAAAGAQSDTDRLLMLERAIDPVIVDWRYLPADVPEAMKADFDDSDWKTNSPPFNWGPEKVAWLRNRITIPERVGGFPVTGSKATLKIGVDDDGIIYVDGKEVQRFHWDGGSVVLTENAQPGESYFVAIKGLNGPEQGSLMSARLEFSVLDDVTAEIRSFMLAYKRVRELARNEPNIDAFPKALAAVEQAVDLDAYEKGDKKRFLESVGDARRAFEPLAEHTKKQTIHLVGHAHIDMNWLWLWPETVQVCKDTFTSALDFMDEFPDFRFSQSQASTYLAMEEYHPDIFERIKEKVEAGQWEITGGTWVEGDMNMASGESIVRQILYANRYFRDKFGVEPQICWEPDTFGHAITLPQILSKSGLKYYYFCRAGKGQMLFWWESPDGSRILTYNEPSWYSGVINEGTAGRANHMQRDYGMKDSMFVYGVGDHGGGPTRADVEKAIQMEKSGVFPEMRFSSTQEFFQTVEAANPELPVIRDELNFVFEGCYTTHGDVKKWNRDSENLLPAAEVFSTIAVKHGVPYPAADFVRAWRHTCFNQFHDIFDGSSINEAYDYSRDLYDETMTLGRGALMGAAEAISQDIDTRGPGQPIVVFNPLSWERDDIVSLPLSEVGQAVDLVVTDGKRTWPVQRNGEQIMFIARGVPSMGYKVFWLAKGDGGGHKRLATGKDDMEDRFYKNMNAIENQFYRVTIDPTAGVISSIYDKKAKREVMPEGSRAALLQIHLEEPHHMSAWNIGPISKVIELDKPEEVTAVEWGPVKVAIRLAHRYNDSLILQDVTLYDGVPRIDIKTWADWRELGTHTTDAPMLKVAFPTALKDPEATFEVPFGSIARPANGHEVPAQKWIDVSDKSYGVSLLNDCKYGHDVTENVMRLTLLRSSYEPDPTPDQGIHEITYSLFPHSGGWRKAGTVRRAYELNNPLIPVRAEAHSGTLASRHSFLSISPANFVVTALKKAEDSEDLILRFFDSTGEGGNARIKLNLPLSQWLETDMIERPEGEANRIRRGEFAVKTGKHEIKTIMLRK